MRCDFVKDDGERCAVTFGVNERTGKCWHHDPDRAEERKKAASDGGRTRADQIRKFRQRLADASEIPPPPQTAEDARQCSSWAVHAIAAGAMDRMTARDYLSGVKVFLSALKQADHEARIERLEEKEAERARREGK